MLGQFTLQPQKYCLKMENFYCCTVLNSTDVIFLYCSLFLQISGTRWHQREQCTHPWSKAPFSYSLQPACTIAFHLFGIMVRSGSVGILMKLHRNVGVNNELVNFFAIPNLFSLFLIKSRISVQCNSFTGYLLCNLKFLFKSSHKNRTQDLLPN